MKKILSTILSLCFLCQLVYSQDTRVRLFVTDSMNRHDTIEFGFDEISTINIDAFLGEQDIYGQVWDSLDMRVIERDSLSHHCLHTTHWSNISSEEELYYEYNRDYKINYRPATGAFGTINMNFEIMIKALNPPIYITTDFSGMSYSPYEGWSVLHLLSEDCFTLETKSMCLGFNNDTIYTSNDTLLTLVAEFQHEVSVEDIEAEKIQIYPNPVQSELTVVSDKPIVCELCDIYGRQILKSERKQIDVRGLERGLYIVRIFNKIGRLLKTEKIVINTYDK